MDSKGDQIVAQPVAPCENKTKLSSHHCEYAEYASTGATYFVFMMSVGVVLRHFGDRDFSTVLTLGAGLQCLGFFLLSLKVKYQKTVAGLSSKTLEMYIIFFFLRLASTLFKNGYLPVDRTGDHVYQIADIGSLLVVLSLIFDIHKTYKDTYQAEHDTLAVWKAIPACILLSVFVHGDLKDRKSVV